MSKSNKRKCRHCRNRYDSNDPLSIRGYCSEKCKSVVISKGVRYQADKIGKHTKELNEKQHRSETEFKKLLDAEGLYGYVTNRQIGPYYADFCHFQYKVIIEVDGNYHNLLEQKRIDKMKDKLYKRLGFKVFRVKFPFILADITSVVSELKSIHSIPGQPKPVLQREHEKGGHANMRLILMKRIEKAKRKLNEAKEKHPVSIIKALELKIFKLKQELEFRP